MEMALVKIVDDILQSIDSGFIVALVDLAISAAFDLVNHVTLLARVSSEFGVADTSLSCVESYLSGRSFFVRVCESSVPVTQVSSGIP